MTTESREGRGERREEGGGRFSSYELFEMSHW
jgi:hypothetical protein